MIIKLVSAFAGLDQKLLLSVQDIEIVKKALSGIAKKLFIDSMDEYTLRFANKDGDAVDYAKPALDYSKAWNKQGVKTGSIIYVLKKSAELSEEEQAKIRAEAAAAEAAEAAQNKNNDDDGDNQDDNDGEAAPAAATSASNNIPPKPGSRPPSPGAKPPTPPPGKVVKEVAPPPPPPGTPPRTATPPLPNANRPAGAAQPVPTNVAAQQQQQHIVTSPAPASAAWSPPPPPPPPTSDSPPPPVSAPLFSSPSAPPPLGPITVINTSDPSIASSTTDAKTAESMIYQLREQNRMLRDQVFALEARNRELEAKAINAAYSAESSPAVIAQMQLKLRDAATEIDRLRSSEAFLREQLEKVQGPKSQAALSVLDKLDPQTRAMLLEDKEALDSFVERRRQTLASTLSLYQLAHDDVEQARIRSQQEKERRDSVLASSAFSRPPPSIAASQQQQGRPAAAAAIMPRRF